MPYGLRGYSRGFGDFVPTLCDPMDVACVEKNAAASVAYQQQQQEQSAGSFRDQCLANGTDPAVCDARWPSGYAGDVPFLNLTPQQQADQMATPTQAAYQMLTNPNVAGELHDFGLNPLALLPGGYKVVDEYATPPGQVYVQPSGILPAAAPKASSPANPAPGIVATMPPLPASACGPTQTYIPPGGRFTMGRMAGQITPTGACQDGSPALTPTFTLPTVGGFDLSTVPWWGWAGAAAVAFFAFGGKR
jgi:hypothetical protein